MSKFKVGDRVADTWRNCGTPLGSVTDIHNSNMTITFDDGHVDGYSLEASRIIPEMKHYLAGAQEMSRVGGGRAERHNDGKVDLTFIPTDAAEAEARVWAFGARKYDRNQWTKLWGDDTVNIVLASLLRHAAAIQDGESHDEESGCQHAAHIRCNAAMLIRYFNQKGKK